MARPTSEVRPLLERLISTLDRAGAQLHEGWPPRYDLGEALNNHMFLLGAYNFSVEGKQEQEADRKRYRQDPAHPLPVLRLRLASGALGSYADWRQEYFKQLAFRGMWQQHFEQVDVFLMPSSFTPAFHHMHEADFNSRMIDTPDGKKPYMQLMPWMVTASLTGCPATVAPIGQTSAGLPSWNPDYGALLGRGDADRIRRSTRTGNRRLQTASGIHYFYCNVSCLP